MSIYTYINKKYINSIEEEKFDSKTAAVKYLQANGYKKADKSAINRALTNDALAYGRTWKLL